MKSNLEIAKEVIAGKWGNDKTRYNALTAEGYDYYAIQYLVNKILAGEDVTSISENPSTENPVDTGMLLNVEVDLTKYNGVMLIIKGE